ncbi:MAG: SDR family oxidoreductase [Deltaproteobacteria bacterium]|nr:SDR family oxidoreductase [Deltaproteobacteria bacterium]
MRLKDRVAIVTGGARGIGAAYARGLAREGAAVAAVDILDPASLVKEITTNDGKAIPMVADVADESQTREMARKVAETFGRIDILINNAAFFASIDRKPFEEITVEEWDKVMAVNVRGSFLCAKAVAPYMKAQKRGKIVNVASGTFFKGNENFLHYVSSKGAVIAMTRCLARELGPYHINVNAIAPGFTMSEALLEKGENADAQTIRSRILKRRINPEDLVGTILYLSSSDSDMMTGQVLLVDGGAAFH